MSDSVVDRDQGQQKKFGEALVEFEDGMKSVCTSLKHHIEDASDNIQDDNAAQALAYLLSLIEEIESELPGTAEFGTRQKVLAKHIQDAHDFRFSRR